MKAISTITIYLWIFVILIAIVACSKEKPDWEQAKTTNTIESYKEYLSKYPAGKNIQEAQISIESLSWDQVKGSGSIEVLESFIAEFPKNSHVAEAQKMIDDIKYTPSKDVLDGCIRQAVRDYFPQIKDWSMWTVYVFIEETGKYDKEKGFLKVKGAGSIEGMGNYYSMIPSYFKVTTDGKGKWFAKAVD